jgi:tetratricopeptide (TPR) repeat protein
MEEAETCRGPMRARRAAAILPNEENEMVNDNLTMTIDASQDLLLSGIRELSCGNEGAALAAFACALSVDSTLGALCSARLHMLRREHAEALALLQELIDQEPDIAEAHFLLGQVYRACCLPFEAVACFRRVLALEPDDPRAAAALSLLLEVQEP